MIGRNAFFILLMVNLVTMTSQVFAQSFGGPIPGMGNRVGGGGGPYPNPGQDYRPGPPAPGPLPPPPGGIGNPNPTPYPAPYPDPRDGRRPWPPPGRYPRPNPPGRYPPPPPPANPVGQLVPVYRFNGRQHFQTLDVQEGINARMNYEGISFYVSTQPVQGMVPLYRCNNPYVGDHMLSTQANCEGYQNEGLIGWIFPQANYYAQTAIYRCSSRTVADHLTTVDPGECQRAGYNIDYVQGFVSR